MIGGLLIALGRLVNRLYGTSVPSVSASQEQKSVVDHVTHGDFTCEICGKWRHGSLIEVMHLPVPGLEQHFPGIRRNLRYCINPQCVIEASFQRISMMAALEVRHTKEEIHRER